MSELKIKFFDELTGRELYEIVRARCAVFLLEEGIVCEDFDRVDYDALHCFLFDGEGVLAYLRAYRAGGEVKLGRVLSTTHGVGLGTRLMKESLPKIREIFGCERIVIHSQRGAVRFYERLGFVISSEEFLEEGIPHIEMTLDFS